MIRTFFIVSIYDRMKAVTEQYSRMYLFMGYRECYKDLSGERKCMRMN